MGLLLLGADCPGGVTVSVYRGGQRYTPSVNNDSVRALVKRCEEQVESSDGVLRLAVEEHLIKELMANETVVEIVFDEVRTYRVASRNRSVDLNRMLIPITGDLAGEVTTIFYGKGSGYSSGPLRNAAGSAPVSELVESLGLFAD